MDRLLIQRLYALDKRLKRIFPAGIFKVLGKGLADDIVGIAILPDKLDELTQSPGKDQRVLAGILKSIADEDHLIWGRSTYRFTADEVEKTLNEAHL